MDCSFQFGGRWRNGGYVPPCPNPTLIACKSVVDNTNVLEKIYVSASNGRIYSYNVVTNTFVMETNANISGITTIAYYPNGSLYGMAGTIIKRLNILTSLGFPLSTPCPNLCAGACFDSDSNLYMYNFGNGILYKLSGINALNDLAPFTIYDYGGPIATTYMNGGGDVTFYNQDLLLLGVLNGAQRICKVNFTNPQRTALDPVNPIELIGNVVSAQSGNTMSGFIGLTVLNGVLYGCTSTHMYSLQLNSNNAVATLIGAAPNGVNLLDAACIVEALNS